jgi:hypothetical protein
MVSATLCCWEIHLRELAFFAKKIRIEKKSSSSSCSAPGALHCLVVNRLAKSKKVVVQQQQAQGEQLV